MSFLNFCGKYSLIIMATHGTLKFKDLVIAGWEAIAGISSMQEMTREFNDEAVVQNLYHFMGSTSMEYLPHGVTVNEFLERLDPAELEDIQSDIVYRMIRRKTFDDAKVLGRWLILVEGLNGMKDVQRKMIII